LAADSSASDITIGIQQLVEKIKRIGNQPILYGGSGDVGLLQKIDECLTGFSPKTNIKNIRQELRKCIVPEVRESRQSHVPYPDPTYHQPPVSVLLFACVINRQSWIIEMDMDCRDTHYGKEYGHFYAIGSGKPLAQAIFSPYLHIERDLSLGKIFIYRVLSDSIQLASGMIDHPIHIYTIDLGGNVSKLDAAEIEGLKNAVELWHSLERESVGKLIATLKGQSTEEVPLEIPKPTE
jgi:hypothetical protein